MENRVQFLPLLKKNAADIFRAYSTVFFLDSVAAGVFISVTTFLIPNIGITGIVAVLSALSVRLFITFSQQTFELLLFNSLLVGLAIGAFFTLNGKVLILTVAATFFTIAVSAALSHLFTRGAQLPVLSLPFLLVAAISILAARKSMVSESVLNGNFYDRSWLNIYYENSFWINFFESLGATYFSPHIVAGVVIFIVILFRSRYLAFLSLSGFALGSTVLKNILDQDTVIDLLSWTGFNFALVAMALGGVFLIPGLLSFIVAMLAVVLSAFILVAMQDFLFVYELPVLVLPFVFISLVFLLALRAREDRKQPWLAPQPGLPEVNFENARLAKVRNGEFNSIPLLPPFYGEWHVYQGFNGSHTHKDQWQHALDFYILVDGKSFDNGGKDLTDYFCYGLPVLSPVHGQVIRIQSGLPDNVPGEVDIKNNWGNFVLIRLEGGFHVLVAHLKKSSILVKEGAWVKPGERLAACGNSGRSPQPHLHIQVQNNAELGSPTVPFHLQSIIYHPSDQSGGEYRLANIPLTGESIEPAAIDEKLLDPLHMPVGRQLSYEFFNENERDAQFVTLKVELTLLGEFRLVSNSGASAAFVENNGVLAFYDRRGPKDKLLDLWLLSNGLTPLAKVVQKWSDSPSAYLLPLNKVQTLWLKSLRPLGCGIDSRYSRKWVSQNQYWLQKSIHEIRVGHVLCRAEVESLIDPFLGCKEMSLRCGPHQWKAILKEVGLSTDEGIPGWTIPGKPQEISE